MFCVEMEVANFRRVLQVSRVRKQLMAAGGFGLVGVIVSHIFVMDPLKIATRLPLKLPTPLAVPLITRPDLPESNEFYVADFSDE